MDSSSIEQLVTDAQREISRATSPSELANMRVRYLGRKGELAKVMHTVSSASPSERPALGRAANQAKQQLEQLFAQQTQSVPTSLPMTLEPTLPRERPERGHLHPITQFTERMVTIWRSLGYDIHEGPELEHQWFNFEGLNIPPNHPARDIHDTFFIKDHPELVMRTHISTVQLRSLLHRKPPLKFVEIGRAYRHEATDATHESMFTECEGIALGKDLTLAHLVTTLKTFLNLLFEKEVTVRVRPSYFPFVEPGIEIDMEWTKDGQTRWLEMIGAGMVHPNVLKAMKLDPNKWSGFAWGMGVDRLVMQYYGIPDVRLSYSGNLDFLKQF